MIGIDIEKILELAPSPSYVVDLGRLRHNLAILDSVQKRSGAKILMALKAFSMWSVFPLIGRPCVESVPVHRGRRGSAARSSVVRCTALPQPSRKVMSGNCSGFRTTWCSIPLTQLERFRPLWEKEHGRVSIGLRVNPEHTEGHTAIYDPCAPKSRLGIRRAEFEGRSLAGVEGLHFHTLCEQLFEPLQRTAVVFENKFGEFLPGMKWLNLGGGHHITREGYDIDALVELVRYFREKYGLEVYLEPGEAIAIGTGILVSEVLDVVRNEAEIAILDVSATCHMPDILEMPYRPGIKGGFDAGDKHYTYRLAGPSCLAGDVIGDWSFDQPLSPGDRLAFLDMAHYTMVKTTTFNGIQHPHICTFEPDTGELKVVRSFTYQDFKSRLS